MKLTGKKTAEKQAKVIYIEEEVVSLPERRKTEPLKKKRLPKRRSKKWIIRLALLAVIAIFVANAVRNTKNATEEAKSSIYTYEAPMKRDISAVLTGSSTLEPADSYTVSTLASGEVLSAKFEEGDVVEKGDTLFEIDSSDAATSIERAEIVVEQNQRVYDSKVASARKLAVTSPVAGVITDIAAHRGETISTQMAVATVEDVSVLTLTEYYSDNLQDIIKVGMIATVHVPGETLWLGGVVKEILSMKRTSAADVSCFGVVIEVANNGVLTSGMMATCWLNGGEAGDIYPEITDEDGFESSNSTKVFSGITGTVAEIYVSNNYKITAGQTILRLSSDTLDNEISNAADALKDSELALENQRRVLDDYTITAPIRGTIVDKYFKEGETIDGAGTTLCIIYDLSSLNFIMNVDELDISKISVGQKAEITAQTVPGETYEGIITKVGINGVANNGVTTYPVTVQINKHEGLLPGMNVDVSIVVGQVNQVMSVPVTAVERGDRVLVKTEDGTTGEGAPEGLKYVSVITGMSDEDYVEIISGLKPGDTVAYIPAESRGTDLLMMMSNGNRPMVAGGGN